MHTPQSTAAKHFLVRKIGDDLCSANSGASSASEDWLAVEEPLEIRLTWGDARRETRSLSITMRTPGHDEELACGFLLSEGIIQCADDIESVSHMGKPSGERSLQNIVRVALKPHVEVDFDKLERHFYTSSSCGVCGKASLNAVRHQGIAPLTRDGHSEDRVLVSAHTIQRLPQTLRESQSVFNQTGGLHASALFSISGELQMLREDVGRHNALDKLIGAHLREHRPMNKSVLLVSGRASFELVQKALVARIPVMAAIGAPSSLAVELAQRFNLTLLGFVRADRFNIYSGEWRLKEN